MSSGTVRIDPTTGPHVLLIIDPGTGEIEIYGPVDAMHAAEEAGALRERVGGDGPGAVGVLVLPLRPANGGTNRTIARPAPADPPETLHLVAPPAEWHHGRGAGAAADG